MVTDLQISAQRGWSFQTCDGPKIAQQVCCFWPFFKFFLQFHFWHLKIAMFREMRSAQMVRCGQRMKNVMGEQSTRNSGMGHDSMQHPLCICKLCVDVSSIFFSAFASTFARKRAWFVPNCKENLELSRHLDQLDIIYEAHRETMLQLRFRGSFASFFWMITGSQISVVVSYHHIIFAIEMISTWETTKTAVAVWTSAYRASPTTLHGCLQLMIQPQASYKLLLQTSPMEMLGVGQLSPQWYGDIVKDAAVSA